jgi:heterogeneous nuclear ribonucleoprotein A1/A3
MAGYGEENQDAMNGYEEEEEEEVEVEEEVDEEEEVEEEEEPHEVLGAAELEQDAAAEGPRGGVRDGDGVAGDIVGNGDAAGKEGRGDAASG